MRVSRLVVREDVRRALDEDLGAGDITAGLIPYGHVAHGQIICREHAVFCGREWFDEVFREIDPRITIEWDVDDGDPLIPDQVFCRFSGPAGALVQGERTALNFLQMLSGIATVSRRYSDALKGFGTGVKLLDTRKTLPGLRVAQKYATACGGCVNHRLTLAESFLVKENHIVACGSITKAVGVARQHNSYSKLEVEVENLDELQEALTAGADMVLLDNFTPQLVHDALKLNQGRMLIEVSGGVSWDTLKDYAIKGVDFISVGALTKDLKAVDFSMRFSYSGT